MYGTEEEMLQYRNLKAEIRLETGSEKGFRVPPTSTVTVTNNTLYPL